ncbi:uncharacterized protein [Hyperolius riggenbachi]|uniref:uncharacterized protein isoform X1 n=1 Tax=Hyperolius riggenbachi TaxID=752182 RepID=UPI0035A39568
MDCRKTPLLLLLLLCHTGTALEMVAPSEHIARLGSQAYIPCSFTEDTFPVDSKYFAVFWYFERNYILSYDETAALTATNHKYSLNKEEALNGNASLIISNLSVSDGGVYTCAVTHSPLRVEKEIRVDVQGIPKIAVTNKVIIINEESVLRSSISGFYPEDIDIEWLRDGEILDNVIVEKPQRLLDGTYSVTSSVTVTPTEEDRGRTFSCRVQHESLTQPLQEDFTLVYGARPQLSIPRKDVESNTETTLTCMVMGFSPPDIKIMWIRDQKILDNQQSGQLQKTKQGTYQMNSTMTFTPTKEDRNVTFSCKVQHVSLRQPIQEVFTLVFKEESYTVAIIFCSVLAVCSVIAAVMSIFWFRRQQTNEDFTVMDIEGPAKMVAGQKAALSCIAIGCTAHTTVTWLEKRDGRLSEVPKSPGDPEEEERLLGTQYKVTSQRDGAQLSSTLTFTPDVVQHRDVTLICRYTHRGENMERTYICSPMPGNLTELRMEDISVPELVTGCNATLSCRITNHVVGVHTVDWYIKRNSTDQPIIATYDPNKIPSVGSDDISSKNYTAFLALLPVQESDNGTEFICRVTLPGLAQPIERSTGPISVKVCGTPTRQQNTEIRESRSPQSTISQPTELQFPVKQGDSEPDGKESPLISEGHNESPPFPGLKTSPPLSVGLEQSPPLLKEHKESTPSPEEHKESGPSPEEHKESGPSPEEHKEGAPSPEEHKEGAPSPEEHKEGAPSPETKEMDSSSHVTPETMPVSQRVDPKTPQNGNLPEPEMENISVPELTTGCKVTLSCRITNYLVGRDYIQWFVKQKSTDELFNAANDPKKIPSVGKDETSINTYIAFLALMPVQASDNGTEFICRVTLPGTDKTKERNTGPLRVKVSATLNKQRNSAFQQTCNVQSSVSQPTELQSPAKQGDYLGTTGMETTPLSEAQEKSVQLPNGQEDKSETSKTMFDSETEISKTQNGNLLEPEMEDISVPELTTGCNATLSCRITNYVVGVDTVQWYIKQKSTDEPINSTNQPKKIPSVGKDETSVNTHIAFLALMPVQESDNGAEFICRVIFPGTNKTLEKCAGPISVKAFGTLQKQQNSAIRQSLGLQSTVSQPTELQSPAKPNEVMPAGKESALLPKRPEESELSEETKESTLIPERGEGAAVPGGQDERAPPPARQKKGTPLPVQESSLLTVREEKSALLLLGEENSALLPAGEEKSAQLPVGEENSALLPAGEEKSAQLPAGEEKSAQLPAGEEKSAQLPVGEENSTLLPVGQEKSALLPVGEENSTLLRVGEENSTQLPVGKENSAQLPVGEEKRAQLPVGEEKRAQLPVGEENSTQLPVGEEKSAQLPVGEEKSAQLPVGEEKSAQLPVGEEKDAQLPVGEENSALLPVGEEKDAQLPVGEENSALLPVGEENSTHQ